MKADGYYAHGRSIATRSATHVATVIEMAPRYRLELSPDDRGFQKRMAERMEVSTAAGRMKDAG